MIGICSRAPDSQESIPSGKIERGKTLSEQAYEVLCQRIRAMSPGDNRLPSEEVLSREYGVSRATIREACKQLTAEGYIFKAPGHGMLAHPSAFAMKNRIDLISDFRLLLAQNYEQVDLEISHVGILEKPRMTGAHPWKYEDGEIFGMAWTYLGNGAPLIHGLFELPVSVFSAIPASDFHVRDLPEFSRRYLKAPVSYCAMSAKCGFHAEAARLFGVEETRPLQCWDETLFDIGDRPVGYSTFYLHPDEVVMSVLTKF